MTLLRAVQYTLNFLIFCYQTIPLAKDYPEKVRKVWDSNSPQNLPDVTLIQENATISGGSCCDNGRYRFKDCGTWWYICPNWGLRDHKTWLKFGRYGLSMPLSTEHQATCEYRKERTQCDIPKDCTSRIPLWKGKDTNPDTCLEIPIIRARPESE